MKMKTLSIVAAVLLGGLANLAWASVPFVLHDGGNNIVDGIYMSPYNASVNGVPTTVICDDFADDVIAGEAWKVNTSTVADLAGNYSSGVTWNATNPLTLGLTQSEQQTGYDEMAWLATQLAAQLQLPVNQQNLPMQADISFAIWSVFDPAGVQSWISNPAYSADSSWLKSGISDWLGQAENPANYGGDFSNVSIYTPVDGTQSWGGRPQEFLAVQTVRADEASTITTLGFDFTCLAVLLYFFRRHLSTKLN